MWKQTLKSFVALIEVEHKIFTWRSVWSGTRLGHLSVHVFVFSDCSLKRTKNTPASRWLQSSTSPTSVKCSVHICILHDYGKQGKKRIKKTDVYRYSCHPLTNILPSLSLLQSCWSKSILLDSLLSHFSSARVIFFSVWIILFWLLSVKHLDFKFLK